MAKMSSSKIEEIVSKELPGYRALARPNNAIDTTRVRRQPEASSPEVDRLMRKFKIDADDDVDFTGSPDGVPNGGVTDDEIVLVEKVNPADPLGRGNRPKAKVLSESGKVTGSQG
jgi:hypothetical protein